MNQMELVEKLDAFFDVAAFDERSRRQRLEDGYESVLQRFAAPGFWEGPWNGLMLSNAEEIDRAYLVVFPSQDVLDTIIAREVQRGAPGALIFAHFLADYQQSGPGTVYITEAQLEELREHKISYYVCHTPLDCHPEISTGLAIARALKLKDLGRFNADHVESSGVFGKAGSAGFEDFARRLAEVTALPRLRYDAIRNNGRPIQQVGIVSGLGGSPENIQAAIDAGCDTFVTGEWWLFGPGEWRAQHREQMREFLHTVSINLLGTSNFASKAVVMREHMPGWFRANAPAVEAMFIGQDNPWR